MTLQSFVPRRTIITTKQIEQGAYLTATAQPYGFFTIMASSFAAPFGQGATLIGTTGANKSNITLNSGFTNVQNPIGFSLMDVTYTYCKVRRARLLCRILPVSDILICSLEANGSQQSVVQQNSLGANPYSKSVIAGPNQKPAELVLEMSSPTVMGYSAIQYEGLPPTLVGSPPSATQQWFFNFQWQNFTSGNPGGNVCFEFELIQEVEFSEPENFTN